MPALCQRCIKGNIRVATYSGILVDVYMATTAFERERHFAQGWQLRILILTKAVHHLWAGIRYFERAVYS